MKKLVPFICKLLKDDGNSVCNVLEPFLIYIIVSVQRYSNKKIFKKLIVNDEQKAVFMSEERAESVISSYIVLKSDQV
jgi:hypothetical protein